MGNQRENKPLSGRLILVTRASGQAGELSAKLQLLGAETIEIPTIQIESPVNLEPLDQAVANLKNYDWIFFASTNSVFYFMGRCSEEDKDILRTRKIAAIGPATKKALAQFDISAVYQPEKSVAEALVEQFPGYPNLTGVRILWPRTNIGRNLVAEKLQLAGALVEIVDTYRTSLPDDAQDSASLLQQYIGQDRETILTVASSQSVRNLTVLLQRGFSIAEGDAAKLAQVLQTTAIISIGPQTTATAVECLGRCDRQADEYNMDGLVKAVCEYVARSSGENSWQH